MALARRTQRGVSRILVRGLKFVPALASHDNGHDCAFAVVLQSSASPTSHEQRQLSGFICRIST